MGLGEEYNLRLKLACKVVLKVTIGQEEPRSNGACRCHP